MQYLILHRNSRTSMSKEMYEFRMNFGESNG